MTTVDEVVAEAGVEVFIAVVVVPVETGFGPKLPALTMTLLAFAGSCDAAVTPVELIVTITGTLVISVSVREKY